MGKWIRMIDGEGDQKERWGRGLGGVMGKGVKRRDGKWIGRRDGKM
jgi:hypothetical protein